MKNGETKKKNLFSFKILLISFQFSFYLLFRNAYRKLSELRLPIDDITFSFKFFLIYVLAIVSNIFVFENGLTTTNLSSDPNERKVFVYQISSHISKDRKWKGKNLGVVKKSLRKDEKMKKDC